MSDGAHMNGPGSPTGKFIDTIDPDDPQYIRNLQRPAEVKEDMKQMEGRSRVSVVLNSQAFKDELEAVIQEQIRQGGPASVYALQQISDLLLPQARGAGSSFGRSSPVIPINDIRGVETFGYSKQEKVMRCKLAACYRLVDLFGWSQGIFNHISARVSQDQEQFLVNPFGMLYSEVTASTLLKVDVRGEVVDTGTTGLGISKAAFTLHSAIHQARPDIRCIIHMHTPSVVAVSATKGGLLPLSQEALLCGKVSYHDYRGILVDQEERDQLARNLGPFNKVMFLRNHGVVACGETIEEAFHYAFNVMGAVDVQVKAMPAGIENLVLVDEETQERTFKIGSQGGGGVDISGRKWKCGELEWDALMRTLDNSGYRTGHIYKQPLMKQDKKERTNSDVELPPSSSSFTYIFDGDYEHSKYVSPIKTAMERQKQAYKAGWLTSPNTYKKQEIEEIGTTTPKKITKWVAGGEQQQQKSTAIKVDTPNQFAPQGANPKEFKEKQKSIRKDYYDEKVTAGPQSKILEGISWDEAAKMKEGGDQTVVVGAASKGIIQRDHQHNAVVYRSYYAANPFENMSEEEVNAYKQEVERRERGEEPEDVPGPEGRLISTEERMQHIQQSREDVQVDTEAGTTLETNLDTAVNDVRPPQGGHSPPPPVSPKVCGWPEPLAPPQHRDEGLDRLVDTVVQAILAAALPDALSKGQHFPGGDGSGLESCPFVSPHASSDALSYTSCQSCSSSSSEQPLTSHPAPGELIPNEAGQQEKAVKTKVKTSVVKTEAPAEDSMSTDLVKTSTVKMDVPVEAGSSADCPEVMTVQLEPLKLFQGKPGDGVMKISFTIQSKVTRRRTKGPKGSWPIEDVTIMQSQPKVTVVQPEGETHVPSSMEKPKILQEQQTNVVAQPVQKDVPTVPRSPSYRQNPAKRPHDSGRQVVGGKLRKPRKKFSRWTRRGLTHPLSPVREEFLDGEDTLEALLARQNVDMDTDDSLEDLLSMTDNYKENQAPCQDHQVSSEISATSDSLAPLATLDDFDDTGYFSPHGSKPREELSGPAQESVFIVPKAPLDLPLPKYLGQETSFIASSDETESHFSDQQLIKAEDDLSVCDKDSQNNENEIRFADEELSTTFPEASDGDTAPRKQVESVGKLDEEIKESPRVNETKAVNEASAPQDYDEDSDYVQDLASSDENAESGACIKPETQQRDEVTEMPRPVAEPPMLSVSAPKEESIMIVAAPLCEAEAFDDLSEPEKGLVSQEESKPGLYRTDSAALETSPVVCGPPFDYPDPIHRELHRVRSIENELDEPSTVQRRSQKGHTTLRRVHSAGPIPLSSNRKTTVIDSTFRTVTIDPARLTESGQPMSSYLLQSPGKGSGDKGRWTLMDTVSKSVEELDVDDLDGVMIYGKSLEVRIHDAVPPQDSVQMPDAHPSKAHSMEDLLSDGEKLAGKGTQLYKEDVVVIAKKPLDFTAISPHKKDLAEEEGPLVTSSPKLGRRKEGSFKKYQSKMGKSEETLLEVSPLTADSSHQAAKRSKSFPKNYGLNKRRASGGTLLNDHPGLFTSERDQEDERTTQSMSVLGKDMQYTGGRRRSEDFLTVDAPSAFHSLDRQLGRRRNKDRVRSKERVKSREMFIDDDRSSNQGIRSQENLADDPLSVRRGQLGRRHSKEKVRSRETLIDDDLHASSKGARSRENLTDDPPTLVQGLERQSGRRRERSREKMRSRETLIDDDHHTSRRSHENITEDPSTMVQSHERRSGRRHERSREKIRSRETLIDDDHPSSNQGASRENVLNENHGADDESLGGEPHKEKSRHPMETPPDQSRRRRRRGARVEEEADVGKSLDPEEDVPRQRGRRRRRRQVETDERPSSTDAVSATDVQRNREPQEEKAQVYSAVVKDEQKKEDDKAQDMVEVPSLTQTAPTVDSDLPEQGEDVEHLDMDELPPPPDELLQTTAEELPAADDQIGDMLLVNRSDEGGSPPRVRGPRNEGEDQSNLAASAAEVIDSTSLKKQISSEPEAVEPVLEETTFLSSFKQPARLSQTVGEDFPSFSVQPPHPTAVHEDNEQKRQANPKEEPVTSLVAETDGIVPIAGNLDILDYGDDEPPRARRSGRRSEAPSGRNKTETRSRVNDVTDRGSDLDLGRPESEPRLRENRRSRDSLASRDSQASVSKSNRDLGSRDSLGPKDSKGSGLIEADMVNYDDEPPRVRRGRHQRDPIVRDIDVEKEVTDTERPGSEGHNRGRRGGRARRRSKAEDELLPPAIWVQAASRESLNAEEQAPELPPKQHRSMEQLMTYDLEPFRSRSQDNLDHHANDEVPPALPPKKNKLKKLSCVSGFDMDQDESRHGRQKKKSKDRSSSKDRKKMPPPPAPPAAEVDYIEEPRRRHRHRKETRNKYLQIPAGDSYYRESSFDASFERDTHSRRRHKRTEGSPSYYSGMEEDDLDGSGEVFKRGDRNKGSSAGNITVSPPHTPKPARKISTSSYGSVTNRPTRSVSFNDGYTPTMSHPPQRHKSRESIASESSLHSTSFRMRSHSGASETSLNSNPLNHEPWRAKAAASRPVVRSRRSRSQGEPTYSANAGRRRRSRPPSTGDANRLYQPRRTRSRGSLPDTPGIPAAPSQPSKYRDTSLLADDSFSDAFSHGYASESMPSAPVRRTESDRHPEKNRDMIKELESRGIGRSKSDRRARGEGDGDKPGSPTKSDPMDSASGGETLEEHSSKEGSPTKEAPSPTKEKKKKKKFRMPSFSKKKKDSKESTI